ncbi:response regulator [Rossellomorea marisflavi]|uniref:Two-component system response regulator n=1 Tax=Rossellomorea marisflavi TaxID=189381 RepID=A0A0J5VG74_9BACI|nr:response regulator [Rossellomorea marisflavi]KMK96394.1 chemotaxis protein CheY [Rossellomorea marisflavi]KML06567.1 chemotaxis protein CheY [Rossellomorea marisflavi]KZE49939.1 two-component system response regulator [Rossellomorea marisflavi]QHA36265.1 response regulator [Rossellomorea marisflavi]TYO72440.1 response regulator [Rossellomorea marisflavi]
MAGILIVDDAKFMRVTLGNMVRSGGHVVVGEAENGLEAVEKFKALQPDLVTMDVTMPEMDGIQAVRRIMDEYPDAVIIMCSAMGQQRVVMDAIEAGAKDFIVKPFEENRVLEAISRILS